MATHYSFYVWSPFSINTYQTRTTGQEKRRARGSIPSSSAVILGRAGGRLAEITRAFLRCNKKYAALMRMVGRMMDMMVGEMQVSKHEVILFISRLYIAYQIF